MKIKKLNCIIPLVIYPFDIMFSFNQTDDELRKEFKKYMIDESNYFEHPFVKGRCSQFPTGQIIIRLRDYPETNRHYGFLQHEIYHAVNYLMSFIGTKYSDDSEECYAYLIAYITEQIYGKLK